MQTKNKATDVRVPPVMMSPARTTASSESVRRLSEWVDGSYEPGMDKELVLRRRIGKLMEEAGEVATALCGYTGENPRKGVTHSRDDVMAELLDVAITALGAWEHMDGNRGYAFLALAAKLEHLVRRAGLVPEEEGASGPVLAPGMAFEAVPLPERFKSQPEPGTRVEVAATGGLTHASCGLVVEPTPTDVQRVRVLWDDGLTTTVRCEQLRPEVTP